MLAFSGASHVPWIVLDLWRLNCFPGAIKVLGVFEDCDVFPQRLLLFAFTDSDFCLEPVT